jgi:hypothetical protein
MGLHKLITLAGSQPWSSPRRSARPKLGSPSKVHTEMPPWMAVDYIIHGSEVLKY